MVYLPSDRRVPATDNASSPSAADYARALLDPMIESWRRQYAAIGTGSVRHAQPQLGYVASVDFLIASATRLAERTEDIRHRLNTSLRPCLDTPPLQDALNEMRSAVLNVRESFDALLDWEREIRSVRVHASVGRVLNSYLGAAAHVIEGASRAIDRWLVDAASGGAHTHTPPMTLDASPAIAAAVAELRRSMRTRATVNCAAWLITAVAILYVILSW